MEQKSIRFTKMQGIGNDYIYINCFEEKINDPAALSIAMSPRHFSVGSDGLVLIGPSDVADAKMRIFNADGSEAQMCGNAIRCVGKYLYERGIVKKNTLTVETLCGIKILSLTIENGIVRSVSVNMGKAILNSKDIPVLIEKNPVIAFPLEVQGKSYRVTCVSMGNPHCIIFGDDPASVELEKIGPHFENHPLFPERINTEFAQIINENTIKMRVWERGSGETYACGTGACATAVAAVLNGYCKKGEDITVSLIGGDLCINYTDQAVIMTGQAGIVYDGVYFLN